MPELLDLAEQVVGWADDGEQVEVVAVHERETEVRAYQGEVEALTVAESQGVGIRVVRDGRQGFAHAGTLDLDVLAETLAEARDNVAFATPDEWCALAEPDGVAHADLDLYRQSLADHPTDAKVEAALDLERRTAAADSRIIGVESAEYADAVAESAVVTTTGIRSTSRETGCHLSAHVLARRRRRDPDRLRVLDRPGPRRPRPWTGLGGRRRTGHPAAGCREAAVDPPDRGARPVGERAVPRHRRFHPQRRERAQGAVAVRRPGG